MQRVPTLSKADWNSEFKAKVNFCRVQTIIYSQLFLCKQFDRYYLLARREKSWGVEGLQKTFNLLCPPNTEKEEDKEGKSLEKYLDQGSLEDLVEDKVLLKRSLLLDIVTRDSTQSCCFTAGYTR